MKPRLFAFFAVATFAIILFPRPAAAAQLTLILRNIDTPGFIEWRVKPEHRFTRSTGDLGRESAEYEQTWDIGEAGANIRFWWGRLNGSVDATVLVNNVVVFKGHCTHFGEGSVRMIETCGYPSVYKTDGGGPYLIDKPQGDSTYIHFATSMMIDRFGGGE
jgi:hypothetical protein